MTRSGSGATPEALPVPSSQLDRFRLRLRQRDRGTVAGAHLIRQRGQSLEFREFRPYLPGDGVKTGSPAIAGGPSTTGSESSRALRSIVSAPASGGGHTLGQSAPASERRSR